MDAPSYTDIFLFDRFRLDRRIRTLSRSDEHGFFAPLAISSRALEILGVLVERPGDLVSRAEIFSAVWPDTVVEDSNLNVQIAGLRRVLDEGRIDGSCIQTIPGRGYRFAVPVIQGERAFGPPASGPQSGNGAAGPIKPVSVVPTAVPTRPRRWFGFAATFLLLAVAGASAAWVWSDRWVGSADTRPRLSMVVLPFTNLGPDPDREDVADAITASLTTDLSRIQDIFLISADKAFSSGNRKLGVRYALEGSVQRSGSQVRVNAQLIDAETDTTLWAERFDGDIGNLFALQDDITRRMAIALNIELINRAAGRLTEHTDPLDYILRGRAAWNRPASPDRYAEQINLFEGALKLDPGSVEAQGWLATTLVGRVLDGMTVSPAADIARAEDLIGQALAASPFDPQAHIARGILFRWLGKPEEATFEFESVLAYNRNATMALFQLGWCKLMVGSIDEVIPAAHQVIHLKPHADLTNWYGRIGWTHLMLSHVDEAIPWLEKARSANPLFWPAHLHLASAYALKGDTERGAAELAEYRRLRGGHYFSSIAQLARGYWGVPKTRALVEATVFAGLRKAGVPEE